MIELTPVAEGQTLTIDQAAEVLQCDTDTAAVRFNSGELPGVKFGRRWVIPAPAFYRRLNELAIEEAERRRAEISKLRKTAAGNVCEPKLMMHGELSTSKGRRRQPLPSLPTLALKDRQSN
jgi:excisionase family DNA binding protein